VKTKVYKFLFFSILILLLTSCAKPQILHHETGFSREGMIYSLKEARVISKERLVKQLERYPVIFLGDFHNSDSVHQFTAELIESLSEDYTLHLANEWFTPADNKQLELFVNSEIKKEKFLKELKWEKRVGYEFKSFEPIYQKIKEHQGKMYGINLSKDEQRRISLLQVDKMSQKEVSFYESLDLNVTVHQQILSPFLSHCHAALKGESDEECMERMYRVQVAWDEKMGQESALLANNILQSPKDKLIVFVGAMHLHSGVGVNMRFARYSDKPFVTVLPCFKREIEHGMADYIYYISIEK